MNILNNSDLAAIRPDEELDWHTLETWLRANVPELAGKMSVAQFHGGHANLTYCITFGEKEVVVRRPPLGRIAPGAHDMAREFKVLSGLAPHFPQAPRVYAYCQDISIIGAPFVVMERCKGVVIRDHIPEGFIASADLFRKVSFALVDALVALQSINVDTVGFGNRAHAEGFVERQLDGWNERWRLASDNAPNATFEAVYQRLKETRPPTRRVSVVHNDLKLDNCLFDPANPERVEAILDWDMTTLGDPLVEFGTLIGYWKEQGDSFDRAPTIQLDMSAFPTRSDLIARYEAQGGEVSNLD
tara:strand:+ start:32938 stop:33840 length:903 start_codon:yes stop_codon:yes gene_type:complete